MMCFATNIINITCHNTYFLTFASEILKSTDAMHYLKRLEEAIKKNWDRPALGNFRGETFTFGDFATQIA